MNVKTHFLVVSICLAYYSCGFLDNGKGGKEMSDIIEKNRDGALKDSHQETQETIDDYTDTYTITPKYGDPKFKELIAQFNKQEHRFEMDACEFKYNGQSFFIGDSAEKIKTIFGEPDGGVVESMDKSAKTYRYTSLGVKFRFFNATNQLFYYDLTITDNKNINILKFRKIPYKSGMSLNDFMTLSDLDHDKLRHTRFSFLIRQKECAPTNESRITTHIASDPVYESKGVGHLNFTGDFDPTSSNKINGFEFSIETLEDIKQ